MLSQPLTPVHMTHHCPHLPRMMENNVERWGDSLITTTTALSIVYKYKNLNIALFVPSTNIKDNETFLKLLVK